MDELASRNRESPGLQDGVAKGGKRRKLFGWGIFGITMGILCGMGYGVLLAWQPVALESLPGYNDREGAPDLKARMKRAVESGQVVRITQEELNRYLASKVKGSQEGMFEILAKYQGVGVKLHAGYLEVMFERVIGGEYHHTVSLYLKVSKAKATRGGEVTRYEFSGGKYFGLVDKGGKVGSLEIPQGYLLFILEGNRQLGKLFEQERELVSAMRRIEITPEAIVMEPYVR